LEELRQRVQIIEGDEAITLRRRFVERFVDTSSAYYLDRIATRHRFRDGSYPTGYLWECARNRERIPEDIFWNASYFDQMVYVLWDSLSSEQVRKPNYWKFPVHAVLTGHYADIITNLPLLPKDIYIVNQVLTCALIRTHETDLENKLFLFRAEARSSLL
jgi:hypothetical protein